MDFSKVYTAAHEGLNDEQRQAVEQIDGPVMVLAGPGTGKTQLLSMRVANILRETDANPQNILCLAFTEAAAANMTDRMAGLFGPDAYKVSANTFHGFCSQAMNQYSEYFYHGARRTAADELQKAEIICDILRELPYDNPLSGSFGDLPTYLKSAQSAISNIKRQAGLTPEKLYKVSEQNLDFIDFIESDLCAVFAKPFGRKKTDMDANIAQVLPVLQKLATYPHPEYTLAELVAKDFTAAVGMAQEIGKTTPLTAFRNQYVDHKKGKMSDRKKTDKIFALAGVYEKYVRIMRERGLYDFDDMILEVGEMLAGNADFKADLQERYQYILIDEFQDTNDAQMNIIYALTDYENPNVMVVGDDDQAIYSFQGANVNNVSKFIQHYAQWNIAKIQLFRNYRSEEKVLTLADSVINASDARIKKSIFESVHDLLTGKKPETPSTVQFLSGETVVDEYSFVANKVSEELQRHSARQSQNPEKSHGSCDYAQDDRLKEIAIIAKKHADLVAILPYLESAGVHNIIYENRQNVLDSAPVRQLELLARIVTYIGIGRNRDANTLLPELLAHPALGLEPVDLWRLSLSVERGKLWLEEMLESGDVIASAAKQSGVVVDSGLPRPATLRSQQVWLAPRNDKLREIAQWLIKMANDVKNTTLEQALDELFAKYHQKYYFTKEKLTKNPDEYIEYLTDLQTIRQIVREHQSTETPTLAQFIDILDLYRRYDTPINAVRRFDENGRVHLLTAHKAKGLEFDTVFILDSSNQKWLSHSGGVNAISLPSNLLLSADQDDNELWRLLFVAITRAKRQLFLTHHKFDRRGKTIKPLELEFFKDELSEVQPRKIAVGEPDPSWNAELVKPTHSLQELLADTLANYKLNATAVNSFVNLEYAGPQAFLLNNLLRFPSAKSASAEFGSSIHETLKLTHQYFVSHGEKMPVKQAQTLFTEDLTARHLISTDHEFYLEKGKNLLETYLNWADFNNNQIVERKITVQIPIPSLRGAQRRGNPGNYKPAGSPRSARNDSIRLTGNLDLLEIDKKAKTITVFDYKTGSPFDKFDSGQKFKTHGYKQQLMFYKLLIENTPEYAGYQVEQGTLHFVEPIDGEIKTLTLTYSEEELKNFIKFLEVVWAKIQNLDFPDTSEYEKNLKGSLEFERNLLFRAGSNLAP
ncbi:hypothetical protein FACS189431_1080 [Alphaproteobacteria bacterium]|nr:hypothetical protein FACS189431_1080 [Alphaproteobacteria bacterium]